MDWENERYVRLYIRDTFTWSRMGWEGQMVFMALLRKVDRAGVMDLGPASPEEALMVMCTWPMADDTLTGIVERGVARLIELEVIVVEDQRLLMPNFLEAQEARQTDRQRARESRLKRREVRNAGAISRRSLPRHTFFLGEVGTGVAHLHETTLNNIDRRVRKLCNESEAQLVHLGSLPVPIQEVADRLGDDFVSPGSLRVTKVLKRWLSELSDNTSRHFCAAWEHFNVEGDTNLGRSVTPDQPDLTSPAEQRAAAAQMSESEHASPSALWRPFLVDLNQAAHADVPRIPIRPNNPPVGLIDLLGMYSPRELLKSYAKYSAVCAEDPEQRKWWVPPRLFRPSVYAVIDGIVNGHGAPGSKPKPTGYTPPPQGYVTLDEPSDRDPETGEPYMDPAEAEKLLSSELFKRLERSN